MIRVAGGRGRLSHDPFLDVESALCRENCQWGGKYCKEYLGKRLDHFKC